MCGIIGYTGKRNSVPFLLDGLQKLEYRGYDSAGIAFFDGVKVTTVKKQGRVSVLAAACRDLTGGAGIGHTRWATHGAPTDINAHPHTYQKFTVVHNGIIENFESLKSGLAGEGFLSETDTEVIAHLLQKNYDGDLMRTLARTAAIIKGSYALAVLCADFPGKIALARHDNPILVGQGKGEFFVASDAVALRGRAKKAFRLENDSFALLSPGKAEFFDKHMAPLNGSAIDVGRVRPEDELGGHKSYMYKEIHEIPATIAATAKSFEKNAAAKEFAQRLAMADNIFAAGCGTAFYSTLVAKNLFERVLRIPFDTDIASEFRYKNPLIGKDDIFIAVSQSGETADTIAAAKLAKERGAFVAVVTNVPASTITNLADIVIPTLSGTEIGVAATKSYVGQITVFMLLAEKACAFRKNPYAETIRENIKKLPELAQNVLARGEFFKELAQKMRAVQRVFYVGRGVDYAVALEGSLKLKEISYLHSEGYPAGELKHGTFALIDASTLVAAVVTQKSVAEKTMNAVYEVKARGAKVLLISSLPKYCKADAADFVFALPAVDESVSPALAVIPEQLFAYYMAEQKGCDPDKPRNLAKSVTVE